MLVEVACLISLRPLARCLGRAERSWRRLALQAGIPAEEFRDQGRWTGDESCMYLHIGDRRSRKLTNVRNSTSPGQKRRWNLSPFFGERVSLVSSVLAL